MGSCHGNPARARSGRSGHPAVTTSGPGRPEASGTPRGGSAGPQVLIAAGRVDWLVSRNDRGPVDWPPAPIRTERLVLREPEARDHAAFIELLASPEVHSYLGGPRPRDELEREVSGVPERWPGSFVVELDGSMIGQILLRRATGHRRPAAAGKVDLGYLFLPRAWGFGYAAEACVAALGLPTSVTAGLQANGWSTGFASESCTSSASGRPLGRSPPGAPDPRTEPSTAPRASAASGTAGLRRAPRTRSRRRPRAPARSP